ncbi:MAG: hypothetical protein JXQ90_03735 [Cyclobacteriaceae bacterium]
MRLLNINSDAYHEHNNKNFLLLGDEGIGTGALRTLVHQKVNKAQTESVDGIWGTLGAIDGQTQWSGKVKISRKGNERSSGELSDEIAALKQLHPEIKAENKRIKEYFINLDEVDFQNDIEGATLSQLNDKLGELRLTLFLEKNEGALVYYELYEGNYNAGKSHILQHVQPESTAGHKFDRDRLDFHIPILPGFPLITEEDSQNWTDDTPVSYDKAADKTSFVIKILKFYRKNKGFDAKDLINQAIYRVVGEKKYKLLRYDQERNCFENITDPKRINTTEKTLLLLHGTFSSTDNSFKGLMDLSEQGSWLQQTLKNGTFKQVLAFDHPTISQSAKDNADKLKEMLKGVTFPQDNPVSVISTSRGGLIARYILQDEEWQQHILPFSDYAAIACANGVHYFDTGKRVALYLNILKQAFKAIGNPAASVITGILEMSAKVFLDMPGAKQMTINDPSLVPLVNSTPVRSQTRIKPIVGDWDKSVRDKEKLLSYWGAIGLDKLIWTVFKGDNDWVVKTDNQRDFPAGQYLEEAYLVHSFHCHYLKKAKTRDPDTNEKETVLKELTSFFQ